MQEKTILVVDDDKLIIQLLSDIIGGAGYNVITARNGNEALKVIKTFPPALILSDINMPEMNGYELLERVHSNPLTLAIPFLFLTSRDQLNDCVQGFEFGADDYILKPFDEEELLARIRISLIRMEKVNFLSNMENQILSGDFAVMSLTEVIQLLQSNNETGELKIYLENNTSSLKMNSGQIVDVSYMDLTGKEAFRSLINQKKGTFNFTRNEEKFSVKIKKTTQNFILSVLSDDDNNM